jgi:hypothetical protein
VWIQRVNTDRELTLTAIRLAVLILASYEIGVGNPVKLSLRGTAEALGVTKAAIMRARDLLVAHGWLIRVNEGSTRTGAYDLGPGPRVSPRIPSRVSPRIPQSNKTSTRLSESERSESLRGLPDREDKSREPDRILPLVRVIGGGR